MAAKRKRKLKQPRRQWTRNPVERPHSTKRGERGYDRKRARRESDEQAHEDLGSDE